MELKLSDGRYVHAQREGFVSVNGIEELAQRLTMKLTARRGRFLPMKDYGSRLYLLPAVKPSQRESAARQYVLEAIADEEGVELEELSLVQNGETAKLELAFSYGGKPIYIETEI